MPSGNEGHIRHDTGKAVACAPRMPRASVPGASGGVARTSNAVRSVSRDGVCEPLAISGTFLHQSLAVRNKLGAAGSREGRDSARAGTGGFTPRTTEAHRP